MSWQGAQPHINMATDSGSGTSLHLLNKQNSFAPFKQEFLSWTLLLMQLCVLKSAMGAWQVSRVPGWSRAGAGFWSRAIITASYARRACPKGNGQGGCWREADFWAALCPPCHLEWPLGASGVASGVLHISQVLLLGTGTEAGRLSQDKASCLEHNENEHRGVQSPQ